MSFIINPVNYGVSFGGFHPWGGFLLSDFKGSIMFLILAMLHSGMQKIDLEDLYTKDKNEVERFWKIVDMLLNQSAADGRRSDAERRLAKKIEEIAKEKNPEKKDAEKKNSDEIFDDLLDGLK